MADDEELRLEKFKTKEVKVKIGEKVPRSMISATCPHCTRSFLLGPKGWRAEKFRGRSCPYCFKVSEQ